MLNSHGNGNVSKESGKLSRVKKIDQRDYTPQKKKKTCQKTASQSAKSYPKPPILDGLPTTFNSAVRLGETQYEVPPALENEHDCLEKGKNLCHNF